MCVCVWGWGGGGGGGGGVVRLGEDLRQGNSFPSPWLTSVFHQIKLLVCGSWARRWSGINKIYKPSSCYYFSLATVV